MKAFVDAYTKKFGEYNDESNTKVYALEYIIETIKANPVAIDNVDEFKKTIDTFEASNPFMKGDAKLKYVGMTSFGQKRQISVPLVVNEYKGGLKNYNKLLAAGEKHQIEKTGAYLRSMMPWMTKKNLKGVQASYS